jgi:hypothetical protein
MVAAPVKKGRGPWFITFTPGTPLIFHEADD